MVQKILGLGLAGTGIVATLIVAGIILNALNIQAALGNFAILAAVIIGVLLGLLGVVSVAKRTIG